MHEESKDIGNHTYDYYLNNNISKLSQPLNRPNSTITVKNPLSELHKNIVRERAKRSSQGGGDKPRSNFERLEQIEAAKIFKDTIFLERQLEGAKGNLI